jgi:hypothetical protein
MQIHRWCRLFVVPALLALGWASTAWSEEPKTAPPPSQEMRKKAREYKGAPAPPKPLSKAADGHWTPYTDPGTAPEDVEVYAIQQGDTLSGVAKSKLGNMYLWPAIWDLNPYIKDAHWIYPGDPLWIKKAAVISEEVPVQETVGGEAEAPKKGLKGLELQLEQEATLPPINYRDLACSGFIVPFQPPMLRIASSQNRELESMGEGQVVYLNEGAKQGHQVGDQFYVVRLGPEIHQPVTGDNLGRFVLRIGQVKILTLLENSSIAQITQSCDEIQYGDPLVPYFAPSIPFDVRASQELPLYLPESDKPRGRVVWQEDQRGAVGQSYIAYVDLGANQKLAPGDKLWVFRYGAMQDNIQTGVKDLFRQAQVDYPEKDLFRRKERTIADSKRSAGQDKPRKEAPNPGEPQDYTKLRKFIGEAVVLTTEAQTACVKIVLSQQEIHIADWIQVE